MNPVGAVAGSYTNSGTTVGAPAGMTARSATANFGGISSMLADAVTEAPGSTGVRTSTYSLTRTATYDSHGNQTSDGSTTFTYDAADRLATTTVGGTVTNYWYDAVDRVVQRFTATEATQYGYGGYTDVAVDTRITSGALQQIVPLPGGTVATVLLDPTGTPTGQLWSYPNLHGHTTVTTDQAGTQVGPITLYDPWGAPLSGPVDPGNVEVTGSFTSYATSGKVTDAGSGVTIMGARPYQTAQARFLTVDPIEGGCANDYTYAFGDPLTQHDLTGQKGCGHLYNPFSWTAKRWKALGGMAVGTVGVIAGGASLLAATPEVALVYGLVSLGSGVLSVALSGCSDGRCAADSVAGLYGLFSTGLTGVAVGNGASAPFWANVGGGLSTAFSTLGGLLNFRNFTKC